MDDKDSMNDVQIDIRQMVQNMVDKAMIDLFAAFAPDDKTRSVLVGIMKVHRKYGIDPITSLKIMVDLGEVLKQSDF